jgi:hypothetical protein
VYTNLTKYTNSGSMFIMKEEKQHFRYMPFDKLEQISKYLGRPGLPDLSDEQDSPQAPIELVEQHQMTSFGSSEYRGVGDQQVKRLTNMGASALIHGGDLPLIDTKKEQYLNNMKIKDERLLGTFVDDVDFYGTIERKWKPFGAQGPPVTNSDLRDARFDDFRREGANRPEEDPSGPIVYGFKTGFKKPFFGSDDMHGDVRYSDPDTIIDRLSFKDGYKIEDRVIESNLHPEYGSSWQYEEDGMRKPMHNVPATQGDFYYSPLTQTNVEDYRFKSLSNNAAKNQYPVGPGLRQPRETITQYQVRTGIVPKR